MELLNKTMYIYIKYEYLSRYGDPGEELYEIKANENTTVQEVKEELNKSFLYGELEPQQYEIYTGGEQEDRDRNRTREPMAYYFTYTEPQLLSDDSKTLKEYNLKDGELLHLKAKLKILLYVPCCRFNTVYFYTHNTLEDIQKEAARIYNSTGGAATQPKKIGASYGLQELEEHEQISTYNIYNYSTIRTII